MVGPVNTAIGLVLGQLADGRFLPGRAGVAGVKAAARDGVVGRAPNGVRPTGRASSEPRQATPGVARDQRRREEGREGGQRPARLLPVGHGHDRRVRRAPRRDGRQAGQGRHHGHRRRRLPPRHRAELRRPASRATSPPTWSTSTAPLRVRGCVDPATVDDDGHGTHVAGTIAAAMNGIGVRGVAPNVGIVNVRAGQDSGYFFLAPTVNALTYSGDVGIDVVNMSFYVDPWAYNCVGGAPEDTAERGGRAGRDHRGHDPGARLRTRPRRHPRGRPGQRARRPRQPATGHLEPRLPELAPSTARTIDNADVLSTSPVEGPHVIGVSAVGPTERKAVLLELDHRPDVRRDRGLGAGWLTTTTAPVARPPRRRRTSILSAAPLHVLQAAGDVDAERRHHRAGRGLRHEGLPRGPRPRRAVRLLPVPAGHLDGLAARRRRRGAGRLGPRQGPGQARLRLAPDTTASILMDSARDKACPAAIARPYDYPAADPGLVQRALRRNRRLQRVLRRRHRQRAGGRQLHPSVPHHGS